MLDALPLTIGLVGAAVCALALWHGRRAARLVDDDVDEPTGLLDRRRFDRDVEACSHRATEPCAVLLIDVQAAADDRAGKRADAVDARAAVAAVVTSLVRAGDIAYRYTGERVAVLMPATDETVAGRVAERIRSGVASVAVDGNALVTVSVGVASGPSQRIWHTIGRASAAAGAAGRNRVAVG